MFHTIEDAISDIKQGKMIIVVDNPDRENEGDLLMAAEKTTPEAINFMASFGKGLICVPAEQNLLQKLHLEQMVHNNTDNHGTAFTVSIDHKDTTTGISAYERSLTIQKMLDNTSCPQDFRRPGHIFPLEAKAGGVIERPGHTEAAVDLARLAGLIPAGIICEIMKNDGTMAKIEDLQTFSQKHNLKIITIHDLIEYRKTHESQIIAVSDAVLPTKFGTFHITGFENIINGEHHIAIHTGNLAENQPVLTRIHSECFTGDILGSERCDCGEQLEFAMKKIQETQCGIILYMRQEGRGIGLLNKIKAYKLQDQNFDTVEANAQLGFPADLRDYSIAAQMLKYFGIKSVNLMTNNPKKIQGLEKYGITISNRVPIQIAYNQNNEFYLKTKKEKLNHKLDF